MNTGLVLAAGESARLPNKVLLPIADGRIAVESAIEFCWRNGVSRVVVVMSPTSCLAPVLAMRRHNVLFVVQSEPLGPVDAMRCAADFCYDEVLVTFGDNVYDLVETPVYSDGTRASVRKVPDVTNLDGWDDSTNTWKCRSENFSHAFAGWVTTHKRDLWGHCSFVDWLTRAKAEVYISAGYQWADIGTPESYLTYLKELP